MTSGAQPIQEESESAYDITRSQAFGPNRRCIQEQLDAALNDLREAYRLSQPRAKEALARAAGRLNVLRNRFER